MFSISVVNSYALPIQTWLHACFAFGPRCEKTFLWGGGGVGFEQQKCRPAWAPAQSDQLIHSDYSQTILLSC